MSNKVTHEKDIPKHRSDLVSTFIKLFENRFGYWLHYVSTVSNSTLVIYSSFFYDVNLPI